MKESFSGLKLMKSRMLRIYIEEIEVCVSVRSHRGLVVVKRETKDKEKRKGTFCRVCT